MFIEYRAPKVLVLMARRVNKSIMMVLVITPYLLELLLNVKANLHVIEINLVCPILWLNMK